MKGMKNIKKIAAASLGVVMLGATFAGAVDLGDYPEPFVSNGKVDSKIVLGANAKVIDVLGAVNIAASFSAAGGEGNVIIETAEGSVANAVPLEIEGDDEFPALNQEATLEFDEDDPEWSHFVGYNDDDITEDLKINVTAIEGSSDCDPKEAVKINEFNYTFTDGTDELEDYVDDLNDDGETDFKYKVELFGKDYYVVGTMETTYTGFNVSTAELQVANADLYLKSSDEVDLEDYGYPGYKLSVEEIYEASSGGDDGSMTISLVNEDGLKVDTETIDEGSSGTLRDGDLKIKIEASSIYWNAETQQYTAKVYFESGKIKPSEYIDSEKTLKLENITLTDGNKLEINVTFSPDDWEDIEEECAIEDNMIYPGNQVGIPGYAMVGFVGLTEQNFANLKIEEPTAGEYKISFDDFDDVSIGDKDTDATSLTIKYVDENWTISSMSGDDEEDFANVAINDTDGFMTFKIEDTEYTLVLNQTFNNESAEIGRYFTLEADFEVDASFDEDFNVTLDVDQNGIWDERVVESDKGTYREGDSADSGVKVVELDEYKRVVEFEVPDDIVRYKVYAGKSVTSEVKEDVTLGVDDKVTVEGTIKSVGGSPLPVGLAILDADLPSPSAVKNGNYVVIGGPCVNTAAAYLLGNPEVCWEGLEEGKAMIKLFENEDNYALLISGYEGEDTLLATEVLGNYKDYANKFKGKKEVEISGTTLNNVQID